MVLSRVCLGNKYKENLPSRTLPNPTPGLRVLDPHDTTNEGSHMNLKALGVKGLGV